MSERDQRYFSDAENMPAVSGLGDSQRLAATTKLIQAFAKRRTPGLWHHIDRDKLSAGLIGRVLNTDSFAQRTTGLCGVMSMTRIWAHDCPEKFARFAIDLYEKGMGTMTGRDTHSLRHIRPSIELRSAAPPPGVDHADWIVSASIRESLNRVFNYSPGEGVFQIKAFTWPGDVEAQFRALGYTRIRSAVSLAKTQGYESLMTASELYQRHWRVILLLNKSFLEGHTAIIHFPNHWVGLDSPIVPKVGGGPPRLHPFRVWSWGQSFEVKENGGPIALDSVSSSYFGYVAGKF